MVLSVPRHGKIDPCEKCGGVANHFEPCVYRCYGCGKPRIALYKGDNYCGGCAEYDTYTSDNGESEDYAA